jgi:apolipoprotein N-acyltransferase
VAKIISPPMPYFFVFLFSLPISLFHLPGYLLWDRFKKHRWSFLLFPAVMTVMEWVQYTFTPFASWGVAAYTQAHSLPLMQSVSLFGMAGLSFLVYWVNVSLAAAAVEGKPKISALRIPLALLFLLIIFGALRLDISKSRARETITVAAVGTDSEVSGLPLPSDESNEKVKAALFARTRRAAGSGANLVVWNEAALFILPEEEKGWSVALAALAAELKVPLLASYVMPVSRDPFRYKNKYLFVDARGAIAYSYLKHRPVPGEPAIRGLEPLKTMDVAGLKVGGAICYDYDFR